VQTQASQLATSGFTLVVTGVRRRAARRNDGLAFFKPQSMREKGPCASGEERNFASNGPFIDMIGKSASTVDASSRLVLHGANATRQSGAE